VDVEHVLRLLTIYKQAGLRDVGVILLFADTGFAELGESKLLIGCYVARASKILRGFTHNAESLNDGTPGEHSSGSNLGEALKAL
jgi:hypothetical protein